MAHLENMARIGLAEILPLKTLTVPPYTTTNTIVYGRDSFVVVDPGTAEPEQQEILSQYLRVRIGKGQRFCGVYLTHHHGDHIKSATFLADNFGVKIAAHKNAVRHLKFPVDQLIDDKQEINLGQDLVLKALYTPGHSDDHLVFLDDSRGVLMAGDMITDRGTVLIPPGSGSLKVYLESLNALTKLSLTAIIPAHGLAITDQPNAFLNTAIKHRYERILAVLQVLLKSPHDLLDATDVTLSIYRSLTTKDLIVFAQLSVESSLAWLLDLDLVQNVNHKWQAIPDAEARKEEAILRPLKEINERLRHA